VSATPLEPDAQAQLATLWPLCYLNPSAARAMAQPHDGLPVVERAWRHLLVALADALAGQTAAASVALSAAREAFVRLAQAADASPHALAGQHWCDEVQAIVLRRSGQPEQARVLQRQIDARPAPPAIAPGAPDPRALHRFVTQMARSATARLLGDLDAALRHQYDADDAALRCALPGLRSVSLSNLGALNQELFNLEDACRFTEAALAEAQAVRSPNLLGAAAANLIVIHNASGETHRSQPMVTLIESASQAGGLLPGGRDRYALQLALAHLGLGRHGAARERLERVRSGEATVPAADGSHRLFWHWLHAREQLETGSAAATAREAEAELQTHSEALWRAHPYLAMELLRTTALAHEQAGQPGLALPRLRQAHTLYEMLVGRGARARYVALEVSWRLKTAQQERDLAVRMQEMAEAEHRRLQTLNDALQAQVRETERLHNQLREQALRDALTGLHNRRFLFEAAPGLLHRAAREGRPLSVAMLDLDHFKRLNDTWGHAAGDAVLRAFAQRLREHLRASDLVCRQGGEEFVVVADGADAQGARAVLERLQTAWTAHRVEHEGTLLPAGSFSAGVAQLGADGPTLDALLKRADEALYAAKAAGRARVHACAA
jgi:diguanylate cyclase (GGDEF)-like protein